MVSDHCEAKEKVPDFSMVSATSHITHMLEPCSDVSDEPWRAGLLPEASAVTPRRSTDPLMPQAPPDTPYLTLSLLTCISCG
jgi:hypothetical protein